MSSAGHLPELESLRSQVADLARELAERDQAMQARQQSVDSELQDLRKQADLLRAIIAGTAADTGDDFFASLATHLTSTLHMQYAVIGEILDGTPSRIRTVAVSSGGHPLDNFEYDLAQAPCGTGLTESFWCFEQDVQALFPNFPPLASTGVESHSGVSIRDKQGNVIGLIMVMDTQPIAHQDRLQALLRVFAPRVAAELQRAQTEMALQEQTRRLAHAQSLAHLGSWEWDIESGETDWSEEQFRIFGHEPGAIAVTYDTFLAALLPDDHDRVLAAVNDALLGKSPLDLECRIVRPNGDIRVIHMRADVQRDATAHPIGMAGTALDITERTQTEEALRTSEERWHLAAQGSNDGIWDWNIQTGEVFFSPRWKAMRGFADHEVSNHIDEWRSRIHPDDLDRVLQSIDHYLAKQTSAFCEEYRVQRKDGSYMWILDRGVALWADDGAPVRMAGSESDITESARAEEALREQIRLSNFLAEVSLALNDNRTIEELIQQCTDKIVQRLDIAFARIWTIKPGDLCGTCHKAAWCHDRTQCLHLGASSGLSANLHGEYRRMPLGALKIGRIAQGTGMMSTNDILNDERLPNKDWMRENGLQSFAGFPLYVAGRVFGVLAVFARSPLSEQTLQTLESAANGVAATITRKQAEEALRLATFTVERAADAVYWIDPHAKILEVNEAACAMLGYSKEELCALTVHDVNPDFHTDMWPAFWTETKQRGTASIETSHRAKDGRIVPVEVHVSHLSYGENEYHCAFVRNITERKRTEAALRASEERFRTVVESSANGLVMVDGEGRIVLLNRQIERLFGYRREELIGRPIEALIPPRFRMHHPSLRAAYQKTPETMMPIRGRDLYGMHQDGGEFPVAIGLSQIETDDGPMTLASVMDLTERTRAEDKQKQLLAELAESQKHFEHIFHWTPSAVAISTLAEGRFLDVNDRLVQLTGYSREELIGHTTAELRLWADPPERARVIQEILQQEALHNKEGLLRTKSGELRTIMISVDRIHVKATPCLIYVAHDITERKQAEIAQARQYEALQAIFRMTVALSHASSLEELYEQGIDGVRRALKVDRASILLFDEDGVMRFTASRGLSEEYKMAVEGHSPWSRETVNPQPMLIQDVGTDPSVAPYREIFVGEGIAALGFIPLVSSDGLLGKFMLYYDTPHQFTEEEIQIAQTIAGHVALMIQRKRAVETLRHSERQLRTVLDSLPIGVWFTDRTGKTLLANPAAKQIWSNIKHVGLQTQENPSGWWETFEPANEPHRWALGHALTMGKSSLNETTLDLEGLDGGKKTIRNTTVPVRDESGTVLGAVILNEDLTEIRRIQEALKLTQFSVDHAVEGFFWIGPDARILHVNDAACRMLEYSREELMAMTVHDIDPHFPPELWPAHWEELKQKGSVALESKQWSKTGRVLDVEITVSYLRYTGQEYHCAIMRDIGERKKAQRALRESEDRLQRALEASGAGTWRVDLHTGLNTRDTGLNRLLGLPAETTVQPVDEWFTFLHPDDRPAMETAWQNASINGLYEVEHRLIRSDGAIRWVYDRGRFVRDEVGQPLYATGAVIDITERKRVEETLRQHERDLRAAIDERERISQDLHDGILQSLYAIGLGLEACKSLQQQQQQQQQCKKTANAITKALDQAVGQLNTVMGEVRNFIAGLDSDILQSGKFSISLRAMIQMLVANHPMRCHLAIDETAVCRLSTEQALHMMNIVREAVSNSLRHGHATKATVSLKPLARSIRLTIRDNGEGFEPADAHSLGHGLSNMRARAKKMGGHFTIQSAPNRGTRVTIDLPQETYHDHVENQTDSAAARR